MISLIIPVYNKAPWLKRCLDSVAQQTDKSAQVIIIDDGSTDECPKICDDYASNYGWEIYHTANKGVSEARNLGLAKAKGDYIAFLDADDALTKGAIDVMNRISRHEFNICQFGQIRHHTRLTRPDKIVKGSYDLQHLPKRWQMVWNKLYKRSFITSHRIKFAKGMQFGEDELFNVRLILANGGLYQAPQILFEHYFDDKGSLCRGQLDLERLKVLDKALNDLKSRQRDPVKREFLSRLILRHRHSELFRRFGFNLEGFGKHDIVYFLKDEPVNEELCYSLRSVEQNFEYRQVWFYGGCPDALEPDKHVTMSQTAPSKFERVRAMLYEACKNDEITEDFWLFNDDFFIMKPVSEDMPALYNKTIPERINKIEARHGGQIEYTKRLRHLVKTLEDAGKPLLDYAVHKPMLINRKKMLEVLDKFPDEPMSRSLYGNYWQISGISKPDMKIEVARYSKIHVAMRDWDFLSTSDRSFKYGNVGLYLRNKFSEPSRFERGV